MDRRLVAANVAIEAVLGSAALQERMAAHGYDRTRLLEGQALYQQASMLYQQQRIYAGERRAATGARDTAREQAHALYVRHIITARLAFKQEADVAHRLDLYARKRTQAGWLTQAQLFYANLLGSRSLVAKMAEYGVTQAQLQAVQAQVGAVAAKMVARAQSTASAREAIHARSAAFRALDSWMNGFLIMSRLALAELS
jgi:hypothetical protein